MPSLEINKPAIGRFRVLLIVVGVVLGCGISASAVISEIFRTTIPKVAAEAWPTNGFALVAVADEKLSEQVIKAGSKPFTAKQWQSIANLALQSYRHEPLNALALRSLALVAEAAGNGIRAKKLMANAVKFSRRDTAANNWQFIQALKAQNLPVSLQLVDRMLRENSALRSQYLPVLIAGVAQPEGYAAIYPMLVKQPQWEATFWAMAASQPSLPAEFGVLRQRILEQREQKTPIIPFLISDVRLIQNLVRSGEFDAAKSLHSYLANRKKTPVASDSGAFAETTFTAYDSAFDWQLTSQGDVLAYVNDTGSGLSIEAGSNAIGVFARHLVKAENGSFQIKISAQAVRDVELFARLKCAEQSKQSVHYELTFATDSWAANQAIGPDCQWFTLELLAQNKSANAALLNIENIKASSIF